MITINELFSGIGAQVAALKRLGVEYETVGISEIDRFAIQSYEAINGKTRNYGDISKVEFLDYADLWTYSFPCTDISLAGKQEGLADKTGKQTRSGLLFEVERLLRKSVEKGTQPKYLLLENVKNLVGKKFKPDFDKWLQTLESIGYNNYWKVLNSKDYGVPQNRERVFVVSIRKDVDTHGYTFPEPFKLNRRLKDVLETNVDEKYYLKQELVETFIKRLAKREVSNTIRCGGAGSIDQKHTWDLVAEPSIVQNPHGYNNGGIIKDNVAPTMTSNGSYHLNNFVCNEAQIKLVGNAYYPDKDYGTGYAGATYDSSGISAMLTTMGGDNREPCVVEGFNDYPDGTSRTIKAQYFKNSLANFTRQDGLGATAVLTTVYGNREQCVVEPINACADGTAPALTAHLHKETVNDCTKLDRHSPALGVKEVGSEIRIRKLTPKECWRLMDFTDEEYEAAEKAGVSKTQLYKQAGNSIVVSVLAAIFKNMFLKGETK